MLKDPCCDPKTQMCDPYDYTHYLKEVSVFTQVTGVILDIGSLISVLPQVWKLYKQKATSGISLHMFIMAMYNQWNTIESIFMAQFNKVMACFQTAKCWTNLVSLFQYFLIFLGYIVAYTQYIYYEGKEIEQTKRLQNNLPPLSFPYATSTVTDAQHRKNWIVYSIFIVYMCISIPGGIVAGIYYGNCDTVFTTFIFIYQITAMITSVLEWVPQIIKTYKCKSCGSFSLLGMCIQTPGQAIGLFVMIGTKTAWYVWLTTVCSLILHTTLLVQLIYYYFFYLGGEYRKNKYITISEKDKQPSEDNLV
ncbi:PQ_loop repeat-containing protein [Hexamita inflata]|uniref:PQ_loop repeat-containing protein n=1 Tax=Hexamita inflata TaxID=28002 RepID=A0ABP1H6V3_9EUKA